MPREQAGLVRQHEQEKLVQKLGCLVKERAENDPNYEDFMAAFATNLIQCIRRGRQGEDERFPKMPTRMQVLLEDLVRRHIQPFVRVPEETNYLLALLFNELEGSIFGVARHDYLFRQRMDPMAALGVPSSTTEVEYAEEPGRIAD